MFWIILLAIVVSLITFLLITPMILIIDTAGNRYEVRLWGVARLNVIPDEQEILLIRLRAFFMTWKIYPLRRTEEKQSDGAASLPEKHRKRRGLRRMPQRMWRVLRSFRVREFRLDMDTGDFAWNAYLYPVFWFLNNRQWETQINFNGRNALRLNIRNRLIRILYAFIR